MNTGPPNVVVSPVSFHQIHIKWDVSSNPDIIAYIVFYRERALTGQEYMSVGTRDNSALVANLRAGTAYSFRVLAYTVYGNGAGSDMVHGTTLESCKSAISFSGVFSISTRF